MNDRLPLTLPPGPEWVPGPPVPPVRGSRIRYAILAFVALILVVAIVAVELFSRGGVPTAGADRPAGVDAVIGGTAPQTWDPALAGDVGTASTLAQVYEGLTAFDPDSRVQPALASSWQLSDDGRRLTFQLRAGITFSDGTPIGAEDVVASWLRLLDPARPSPLASLLSDVSGATEYLRGEDGPEAVGLRAESDRIVIDFRRPAAYFVAVTASPSLAVLPRASAAGRETPDLPAGMVVSGAYLPVEQSETAIRLESNPRHWAGEPSLRVVELLTDTGGESPVALFEQGRVDHIGIGAADASWIRHDDRLGPSLRSAAAFSVDYYGFDTTEPPFDDARVRRAFAKAVDWDRIVRLADPESEPATSLIPAGIPGRGTDDFTPVHDPEGARALLADAGFPSGGGFPDVTLSSYGLAYDEAVATELERELGITVAVEVRPFDEYTRLLDSDPPSFWTLSWIADYPQPQDFLGLLLETGSSNNEGRWSDAGFDAALAAAAGTDDPAEQELHYADAQRVVQREAPVIPVSYGRSWSLARDGLLGAQESGVGFIRLAGVAWEARP